MFHEIPQEKLLVHENNSENSKIFHDGRQIQSQQVICPSVLKRKRRFN
jgi:hypothetical protein